MLSTKDKLTVGDKYAYVTVHMYTQTPAHPDRHNPNSLVHVEHVWPITAEQSLSDITMHIAEAWDFGTLQGVTVHTVMGRTWLRVGEHSTPEGLVYDLLLDDNLLPVVGGSDDILTLASYMLKHMQTVYTYTKK
jgi:hypothetical protein